MGHKQRERLAKSEMASSDDRSCMCCVLETSLTRNFAADLSKSYKSSTITRSPGKV